MVRLPFTKSNEEKAADKAEQDKKNDTASEQQVPTQIIEREITLSLLNEKLNVILNLLQQK